VSDAEGTEAAAGPSSAKLTVFCEPNVREVFEAVVAPTQIWQEDPYDVETIHAEGREAFGRLLARASAVPPPDRGRVLLLKGDAGSGKTHLMRAFRSSAHRDGSAHFAYLQLTTAAAHYGQYMLSNVIASLEHPYAPPAEQATGLQRLSTALLDAVPGLSAEQREAIRAGDTSDGPIAIFDAAERLLADPRFAGRDEDVIRALLFLQRDDPRVRSKVLKWLRGEDLNPYDRGFVGDLQPRPQPEKAVPMIVELGRLILAAQGAALVLCVDQLEDVFNQSESAERFRLVIDVLVTFAETLPSGVVILSCLSDYYESHRQSLPRPRLDRIEHNPEPVRLTAERSADEVTALVARRLGFLYEEAGLLVDPGSTYPFEPHHLAPLANLNTRKVLDYCRLHHQRCVVEQRWVEPTPPGAEPARPREPAPTAAAFSFDQAWNDATNRNVDAPDGEAARAALLMRSAERCNAELPAPYRLTATATDNLIAVEEQGAGEDVRRFLVAVCEKSARGGGLGNQVKGAEAAAAGRPVVLVRSTPYQYGPNTLVAKQIGRLIGTTGGRKVEVVDTDWRAMVAFETFAAEHGSRADFAAWQRDARPLSRLRSLQDILDLKKLTERLVQAPPPTPSPLVAPPPTVAATPAPTELKLGKTRAVMPEPVVILPEELKQHMVFIGGSGTGKTTAALRLIEQLLARGVPAVLIDRKGDLARYADPAAWDVPDDPALPTHGPRRRALRAKLDVALYTPGSGDRGRPLSLPVFPDDLAGATETERGELARFSADVLGSMMGLTGRSQGHGTLLAILSKAIEVMAQGTPAGQPVRLEQVRGLIAGREDTLLNAVGGLDAKHYKKLAELMLTMEINHGPLLSAGGERLDVGRLLGRPDDPGRARLTVINTQALGSNEAVQFWLSRFLLAVDRWRARASSPTLQAILFMDEADQYLPATSKPPTKGPLESLLKRGRSAGLGVMLATQSPGDLDYKGRDNVRGWLVGRVQEAVGINKLKPLFAGSTVDVAARLPQQLPGEFYLLREGRVTGVKAGRSLVETKQLPEEAVLHLARDRPPIARA
jgi:hypothetical protein